MVTSRAAILPTIETPIVVGVVADRIAVTVPVARTFPEPFG